MRRQSANNPTAFREFNVRRNKVAEALVWLKQNNRYYRNITIDNEIIQSLPEDDSIIEMLPQFQEDNIINEDEKGARVMLTANIWTEAGLVNGSMGTIQDIIFEGQGPPSLPAAVLIKFD